MKELVVISGKGGTGKTSVAAAFAALAERKLMADCDVDAADLHLVLRPEILERHAFSGRKQAAIDAGRCTACGVCRDACRFSAIVERTGAAFVVDPFACEGCGLCARLCPADAVRFEPAVNGEWFVSRTPYGPLVHARLGVAEDNSGKLVTLVRNEARSLAEKNGLDLVLVDGAPGIGCPVIASLSGADLALVVTEPTIAGRHDLERVIRLTAHFSLPVAVCVNKADLNPGIASEIEESAIERGALFVSSVSYDQAVTAAQVAGTTVIEHGDGPAARELRQLWAQVAAALGLAGGRPALPDERALRQEVT
jgi:MinD superfamily P-loop ATPase